MIGYVTLGTNNLAKAGEYYDALLGMLGAGRAMEFEGHMIAWGKSMTEPMLCAIVPFDGSAATVGNGVMVSLLMESKDQVDALHQKAMELVSQDEGAPGPRGDDGFYGAYFRDPDGNKLCAFHMPMGG